MYFQIRFLNRFSFFVFPITEALCSIIARNFKYDIGSTDPHGWGKSTALYVIKYVHNIFDEVREKLNITGDTLDPNVPYSQAMLGNYIAKSFDARTVHGNRPLVYMADPNRQRKTYCTYVTYEHKHLFTKPSALVVAAAKTCSQRLVENDPKKLSRVHKDTLYKNHLKIPSTEFTVVRHMMARAMIITFIQKKIHQPEKFLAEFEKSWSYQRGDQEMLKKDTKTTIMYYVGTEPINMQYYFPCKNNFKTNWNRAKEYFKIDRLETLFALQPQNITCFMEKNRHIKLLLISILSEDPVNADCRLLFSELTKLLKSRHEKDFRKWNVKKVETHWVNKFYELDLLLQTGKGAYHTGSIPPCVRLIYKSGCITMKFYTVLYNIRERFQNYRRAASKLLENDEFDDRAKRTLQNDIYTFLDPIGHSSDEATDLLQTYLNQMDE